MFVKKFGVALAAGLVAMACATPAALAADAVKDAEAAVKSAQLDVDYFCAAESEYYDMAKCADAEATLAKANAALEAAKAAAAAPADVASPVPDQTKVALADAQLDAQYFCAEGSEYYDFAKCANLTAQIKDLERRDAELDATWFCAEGTEYYDMVKCADAQARLGAGSNATPDAPAVTPDAPSTAPGNSQADATKPAADAKAPKAKAKEAKGNLAKTGASFAPLMGAAAAIALAGGVMVARKRA